jgi:hypothetical protein
MSSSIEFTLKFIEDAHQKAEPSIATIESKAAIAAITFRNVDKRFVF